MQKHWRKPSYLREDRAMQLMYKFRHVSNFTITASCRGFSATARLSLNILLRCYQYLQKQKKRAIGEGTARCGCKFPDTCRILLQRHRAVSLPQHGFLWTYCYQYVWWIKMYIKFAHVYYLVIQSNSDAEETLKLKLQTRMYYGPGTVDKVVRGSRGTQRKPRADVACALTRWQHFSARNDVMATILKVWRHIKNRTPSVDAYLLVEHSCQISSWSDLKRQSLRLFWRVSPQQEEEQQKQQQQDEFSVPSLSQRNVGLHVVDNIMYDGRLPDRPEPIYAGRP